MARPNRSLRVLSQLRHLAATKPDLLQLPKTTIAKLIGRSKRQFTRDLMDLERRGAVTGLQHHGEDGEFPKTSAPVVLTPLFGTEKDDRPENVRAAGSGFSGLQRGPLNGASSIFSGPLSGPHNGPRQNEVKYLNDNEKVVFSGPRDLPHPSLPSLSLSYSPSLIPPTPQNSAPLRGAGNFGKGSRKTSDPETRVALKPPADGHQQPNEKKLRRLNLPGVGLVLPHVVTSMAMAGQITAEHMNAVMEGPRAHRKALVEGIQARFKGQYQAAWSDAMSRPMIEAEKRVNSPRHRAALRAVTRNIIELRITVEEFMEIAMDTRPATMAISTLAFLGSSAFLEKCTDWIPKHARVARQSYPEGSHIVKPTRKQWEEQERRRAIDPRRPTEDPLYWDDDPDEDLDVVIARNQAYARKKAGG